MILLANDTDEIEKIVENAFDELSDNNIEKSEIRQFFMNLKYNLQVEKTRSVDLIEKNKIKRGLEILDIYRGKNKQIWNE
jgi:predicted Zn-dependent protease with MMP-like domain